MSADTAVRPGTADRPDTSPDPAGDLDLEAYRRDLLGYCYRMLGSASEAEDAVQDTMIRAWGAAAGFEGRSTRRSWLFRIAHNVCVDMHRAPQRRARPMDLGPATRVADADLSETLPEHAWVRPIADHRVVDVEGDPADVVLARESIRLAFVAALQYLPSRQRTALVLCDVLRWPASEVADLLGTSVASVTSALQRARATLAARRDEPLDARLDPAHEDLLARYLDAFQRYDVTALTSLLREDAVMSMPPWPLWLQGPSEIAAWFLGPGIGCRDGRVLPVAVNGTGGFANYKQTSPGVWTPWAVQVVEVAGGRVVGNHAFVDASLFPEFGLPEQITS